MLPIESLTMLLDSKDHNDPKERFLLLLIESVLHP